MSHLTTARYVDPHHRRNNLRVRAVACPTCHAEPGETCVTVGDWQHPRTAPGKPTGNHPARRLMAIRAANTT